jgi:hypothetical protein
MELLTMNFRIIIVLLVEAGIKITVLLLITMPLTLMMVVIPGGHLLEFEEQQVQQEPQEPRV